MTLLTLNDATLAHIIQDYFKEQETPPFIPCTGPTYVALRRQGRRTQASWFYAQTLDETLRAINSQLGAASSTLGLPSDSLELCLTYRYRQISTGQFKRIFGNIYRGIRGIELQYKEHLVRYAPTQMVASNLSFQTIFERFLRQHHLTRETFVEQGGIIQAFEARQVLVQLQPQVIAIPLHRGNRIIPMASLSIDEVQSITTSMGQWLLRQVQADGRMVYKYFPSRGKEFTGNNLIRQFMATLCLIRYAAQTQQPDHRLLASYNLTYNIKQFYRQEGAFGFVEYDGKVKLGAVALAALCLLEHAKFEMNDGENQAPLSVLMRSTHGKIFRALCQTVDHLWQPDGSFRTFLKPSDRDDNQNFYPGEALLFWASLYAHNRDPQLLERCYRSFAYYRDWHRQQPNPAFIPWHTQAYAGFYRATGDPQFLNFIFEMNDWLLPMQQIESARYSDLRGRFYDPTHPEYGSPHASSTGVYLEGLATAYNLALQVGDEERVQRYEAAIWWGIRSLRQLQFRDAVDLFYISRPEAVHGGLRTTVYDNVIRVDNVQHGMMALLMLVHHPQFCRSAPPGQGTAAASESPSPSGTPAPLRYSYSAEANQNGSPSTASGKAQVALCQTAAITATLQAATAKDAPALEEFRLLDPQVNIQPILEEIKANAHLWLYNTSRQNRVKVQRETNTIHLRSAVKPFPAGVTNGNDVHPSKRTKMADKFPLTMGWLQKVAHTISGELGRATLVRLAPRGRVYRHIDHGEYYRVRDRYHLVLHSPVGSLLGVGDEWVRMQPGECWWFNNKAPHEAINEADDWRIHLIFDVLNG